MSDVLTIRLDDQTMKELKVISKAENISVSDFVRDTLKKSILVEKFRITRARVLPFAEAQGLITDEDVFKALK